MLTNLSVHDFALFDELSVDFRPGFNVLTGETGAGKSILIDAFNIALGGKASSDYIRSGADFFVVQAIFDITGNNAIKAMLDEMDLAYEDDELILSRKVAATGKNTCTANGIRVPVNVLRSLGDSLVDVHGQYENQQLLKPDTYLGLLDSCMSKEGMALRARYINIFAELKSAVKQIRDNAKNAVERERSLDILSWEIEEIEKAALKEHEDKQLEEKSKKLANAEKINSALSAAYAIIDGEGSKYGSLLQSLADVNRQLSFVAGFDESFAKNANRIQEMEYDLAEIKSFLAGQLEDVEIKDDLEYVEQRLDTIYKLKKKYGSDIVDILAYCDKAKKQKEALLRIEEDNEKLEQQKNSLLLEAKSLAEKLTKLRKASAQFFVQQVLGHIHDLAMQQAEFIAEISKKEKLSETGQDEVRFLFSANAGLEARPLNKVASGGELSRIALSIKTVLLGKEGLPTMVFDEVDAGVGGATAQRMAEKLATIALKKQVLCITHLPQIACMADSHISIEKRQSAAGTRIDVEILAEEKRIAEITRMIAGDDDTKLAKDNARQMLSRANEKKNSLRVLAKENLEKRL